MKLTGCGGGGGEGEGATGSGEGGGGGVGDGVAGGGESDGGEGDDTAGIGEAGGGGGALGGPVVGYVLDQTGGASMMGAWFYALLAMGAGSAIVFAVQRHFWRRVQ